MATFTDISELDGYEIPASGETIEINIMENYYGSYVLDGDNIVSFSAEDGNQAGEVVTSDTECRFYGLDGDGEGVTITFEVGQNQDQSYIVFSMATYDTEGELVGDYIFYQEEGEPPTPPTPSWGDGQHKIYRSGHQVIKMYRSGELIYLRMETGSEPQPVTEPMIIHNGTPITGDYAYPTNITVASTDTTAYFDVLMPDQNTPWVITDSTSFNLLGRGTGSTTNYGISIYPTNPEFMSERFVLVYKQGGDVDDDYLDYLGWTGVVSWFKFSTE